MLIDGRPGRMYEVFFTAEAKSGYKGWWCPSCRATSLYID